MEDNPERFFASKYADVWLPGLRRLLNDRLLAHLEREVGGSAPDDALLLVKEPNGSQSADVIMRAQPEARLLFLLRDGRDVVDSELASFLVGAWQERTVRPHARRRRCGAARLRHRLRVPMALADRGGRGRVRRASRAEAHAALRGPARGSPSGTSASSSSGSGSRSGQPRSRPSSTGWRSSGNQGGGPTEINRSATPGAWRENLRPEERAAVEDILGVKLRELGYD